MLRVDADMDFEEEGFESAVSIDEEDARMIIASRNKAKEVITFGEENGAIVDEGEGELILLEIPNGSQLLFPVIDLGNALSDVC